MSTVQFEKILILICCWFLLKTIFYDTFKYCGCEISRYEIFHIDTGTKSVIKMCNFQILQLCVRVPTRIRVPDASHFRWSSRQNIINVNYIFKILCHSYLPWKIGIIREVSKILKMSVSTFAYIIILLCFYLLTFKNCWINS
jgi:hypothetical protein